MGRLLPSGDPLKIDPLILSQSRTSFSFLALLVVLLARRGWHRLNVPAADLVRLALLGVLGVAASNYFYYLAIQKTNVATAIILQYTAPVLVLFYTVLGGLQRATPPKVAAVGLAVAGSGLAIGAVGAGGLRLNAVGVAAGFLAAVAFAFYNIAGHRLLARHDRWIVLLYTTLAARRDCSRATTRSPRRKVLSRRADGMRSKFQSFKVFMFQAPPDPKPMAEHRRPRA
jgi:DME family drug/metabolite transporter